MILNLVFATPQNRGKASGTNQRLTKVIYSLSSQTFDIIIHIETWNNVMMWLQSLVVSMIYCLRLWTSTRFYDKLLKIINIKEAKGDAIILKIKGILWIKEMETLTMAYDHDSSNKCLDGKFLNILICIYYLLIYLQKNEYW
jgi:pantothenate kinase